MKKNYLQKMCFVFCALSILIFLFQITSCKYALHEAFYRDNAVNERAAKVASVATPVTATSSSYKVAIITDVHFGASHGERYEDKFLEWLSKEKPAFVICLGDVMDHGLSEEGEEYKNFADKIKNICGSEVYTVVGNHDLYNSGWNVYRKKIFPYTSLYHFKTEKFSWYFIDSATAYLGDAQMSALADAMKKDASPKIVLSHVPVYSTSKILPVGYFLMQDTEEGDALVTLFAKTNVKLVLEGHTHKNEKVDIKNFTLYNVPGLLDAHNWALMTIDETNATFEIELAN